jgi:hypothetical protein
MTRDVNSGPFDLDQGETPRSDSFEVELVKA